MKFFVSYHIKLGTPGSWGFGNCVIENDVGPPDSAERLTKLSEDIAASLAPKYGDDVEIAILNWIVL